MPAPLGGIEGAVHVVRWDAAYDRGLLEPRGAVASTVLEAIGDRVDFLVVFTGFEYPTGEALAFYNPVRNEVTGIGMPVFDHSQQFGSQGRLQGYVDMAATSRYALNATEPAFRDALNTLAHELMHRWGVAARFRNASGELSSALIGRDGSHWSAGVDSSASIMYGARWTALGNGEFQLTESRQRLSRWDLYLAGFASEAEVPTLSMLRSEQIDPLALPAVGHRVHASVESVRIEQLVAAEGERVPSSANAQRHFTAALVFLARTDQSIDPQQLAQLQRFAGRFESYFQSITEGRASIRFHREGLLGARPGSPAPLIGSPIRRQDDPVAAGLAWLKSQQRANGSFADRPTTSIRDTASAFATIWLVDPAWAGAEAARQFLVSQSPRNEDERLRLSATAPASGFGSAALAVLPTWVSSGFDALLAGALGFESALIEGAEREALAEQLLQLQAEDGSFASVRGGPSRLRATLFGARALFAHWPQGSAATEAVRQWLMNLLLTQPLQGAQAASVSEIAEALEAAAQLRFPESLKLRLQQALEARQGELGDWEGSVHSTAAATLAIARAQLPNLQLLALAQSPEEAVRGEPVTLRARVRNSGGSATPASALRWLRMSADGSPIGSIAPDQLLPPLLPGEAAWLELVIETDQLVAAAELRAHTDPDNLLIELSEDDNAQSYFLQLREPDAGVDLALSERELVLSPARYYRIGEEIQLRGSVRNLGTLSASQALLRLEREFDGVGTTLAETRVDVQGLGQSSFELSFLVEAPGAHALRLRVDPENTSGDVRPENNQARLTLPQEVGVDLELDPASVLLEPDPARVGMDASLRVQIRNLGASDPGPVALELQVHRGSDVVVLQRRQIQLDASAPAQVSFDWRPEREGLHRLELVLDPDQAIVEIDENNNRWQRELTVVSADGTDLAVLAGSTLATPAQPLQGQVLRVQSTLANLGQSRAQSFSAGLFLGDPRSGGALLDAQAGLALEPGQTQTLEFTVLDFPGRGDVSLFVMVDSGLEIAETNETNNLGVIDTIARSKPDLGSGPQEVTVDPPLPVPGLQAQVRARVSNRGEQASEPALAHLLARFDDEFQAIGAPIEIPVLQPSEVFELEWQWQVEEPAPQALRLQIDPERNVIDGDRTNNEVDLPLEGSDAGSVALVPYFSPNGDGVRDRASVLYSSLSAAPTFVEVIDESGRTVQRLDDFRPLADRVQLDWDGRDSRGQIAADGEYALVAHDQAGQRLDMVRVVLDLDRPMAFDSVNSDHVVTRRLPNSIQPWQLPPQGSIAEDYLYAAGDSGNASGPLKQGIARTHALFGGLEPVLSAAWIARNAGGSSVRDLKIEPQRGRELAFVLDSAVWTQPLDLFDRPTRIAALPSGAEQAMLVGYATARTLVLFDRSEDTLWRLDLDSGQFEALAASNGAREVLRLYPEGVLLGSDDLIEGGALPVRFVPTDSAQAAVELDLPYQPGYDCFARYQALDSTPRLLFHALSAQGERIELVDLQSGQRRVLFESTTSNCPGGSDSRVAKQSSSVPGYSVARAQWIEGLDQIAVIEHQALRLRLFSAAGDVLATHALPASARNGEYAQWEGLPAGAHVRGEPIGPSDTCPLRLSADWQTLAERGQLGRSSYSSSRRELYFASGELVLDGREPETPPDYWHSYICHGVTDYFAVSIDSGEARRIAARTAWPLEGAEDRGTYMLISGGDTQPRLPEAWPAFFQRASALLRVDARILGSAGREGRAWPLASNLLDSVHQETRLLLSPSSDSRELGSVLSSLDRMRAELRASSNGRSVSFFGYATDAHLDYYQIDYARADTPEQWLSLVPPRREQVRGDDFMSWAPPQAGAYLFRLRVQDRAGNRAESFASADLVFASPLSSVQIDHRAISPNGDGVQDRARLSFVVTRPTELGLRVRDALGRTVFSADRTFGVEELGPQQWEWTGQQDNGHAVADGDFRIELTAGFAFPLGVDIVAPRIASGSISPSYRPQPRDWVEFSAATDRRGAVDVSAELDVHLQRRASSDTAWTRVEREARIESGGSALSGLLNMGRIERIESQLRWVAQDRAGNRGYLELPPPTPALVLVGANTPELPNSGSWAISGSEPSSFREVPDHRLNRPPSSPITRVIPAPDALVYVMADHADPRQITLDLARSAGSADPRSEPLRWQTAYQGTPTALGDGLFAIAADLSALEEGELFALRVREPEAPVASVSNAMAFNAVETILIGCPNSGHLTILSNVPEEPERVRLLASWPNTTQPPVTLTAERTPHGESGYALWDFRGVPDVTGARIELELTILGRADTWKKLLHWPGCGGSTPQEVSVSVAPYSSGECGSEPTNTVLATVSLPPDSIAFQFELIDPTSPEPRPIADGAAHEIIASGYAIDTRGLPGFEGRVRLRAEVRPGVWQETYATFPIDRSPPTAAITAPASGSRICVNPHEVDGVDGLFATDSRGLHLLESANLSGEAPRYSPLLCNGHPIRRPNPCAGISEPGGLRGESLSERSFSRRLLSLSSVSVGDGPVSFRLRAVDWSGAQTCAQTSVHVDASVELDERREPLPAAADGIPLIAPEGHAERRMARWFYRAREALTLDAQIYAAIATGGSGNQAYRVDGPALVGVQQGAQAAGEFELNWDGRIGGQPAADGVYALRIRAEDGCGHQRTVDRWVRVDSTPPSLDIVAPAAGVELRTAVVQVLGTVVDAHPDTYQLAFSSQGPQGPWQEFAAGIGNVATARVLGLAQTAGHQGEAWVRLSAEDRVGNASERVRGFRLAERSQLISQARLTRTLISPNGDGRLDALELRLSLARAAQLTVDLVSASGAPVARLLDSAQTPAGVFVLPWGQDFNASQTPEGSYRFEIRAREPAAPTEADEAVLDFAIDLTPPTLLWTPSALTHLGCASAALLEVDDPHLADFQAELRSESGAVLRSLGGVAPGQFEFADFDRIAEGGYRLWAQALDLAGNRIEAESALQLDCTPPELALTAPQAGAVLARGAAVSHAIEGFVSDLHARDYALEIAPLQLPEQWQPLWVEPGAAPQGFSRAWSPEVADGDYQLRLRARDLADNTAEQILPIRIDGTPPVAQIFEPADGTTLRSSFRLGVVATDANFAELKLLIASPDQAVRGEWSSLYRATQPVDHDLLPELESGDLGPRVLRLEVLDRAGLKSVADLRVSLDGTPPPVPIDLAAAIESPRNVRLSWRGGEAPDLLGFHIYRRSGNAWQRLNTQPAPDRQYLDRELADGEWHYAVSAVDRAGNESERSASVRVRIDTTPPEVAIIAPQPGERVRGLLGVRGTASSTDDFERAELALLDEQGGLLRVLAEHRLPVRAAQLGSWDTRTRPEDARHSLRLRAWDRTGNQAELVTPVQVDNLPPAAPQGLSGEFAGPDLQLSWLPNAEPDLLGYLLYRNGRLLTGGAALPADLRPLATASNQQLDAQVPDGELSYRVYAIDTAGSISPPSPPFTASRDSGPPSAVLLRPIEGSIFDGPIELVATTEDLDVDSIGFAYRSVGSGPWLPIGEPVRSAPWRQVLDASELSYGDYEIRALATDFGGQVDPQPPIVQIRIDDVSAPATPMGLVARALAAVAQLSWTANSEPDLEGYRLQRFVPAEGWTEIAQLDGTATSYEDPEREIGSHRYRLLAMDVSGNASDASNEAVAEVFAIDLRELPISPTSSNAIEVRGSSPRAGSLRLWRAVEGSVTELGTTALPNPQAFAVPAALLSGRNLMDAALVDARSNQSLSAGFAITQGDAPAAPAALSGSVSDHRVQLNWSAPTGGVELAGYRVYRNGVAVQSDFALSAPLAATEGGTEVPQVLDGQLDTAWRERPAPLDDRLRRRLELRWGAPVLVGGLQLEWTSAAAAARDFDLYGWYDDRWNLLAEVRNQSGDSYLLQLSTAYPTQALRLVPRRAQWPGAEHALAELQVRTRSLTTQVSFEEQVADGRHQYEVAAVSALGFEGARSPVWLAEVGDSTPPPAVVLSGSLSGRDAQLQWTESAAPDLRRYRLLREGQLVAEVNAGEPRSYLDRSLANGVHRYSVEAEDAVGNRSDASNTLTLEVVGSGPGAPLITAALSQLDVPALELHWTPAAGVPAARFRLFASQRADDPAEPYREVARPERSPWLHAGLQYGQRVFYRIQAEDEFGNLSALSAPFEGVVRDLRTPQAPALTWPRFAPSTFDWLQPRYQVCGQAGAGQRIEIRVDDRSVASVQSLAAHALLSPRTLSELAPEELVVSPDGRRLAVRDASGALFEHDLISTQTRALPVWQLSQLRYGADGRTLHGLSIDLGLVLAWDEEQGSRIVNLGMESIERAIESEGGRWLVLGTRESERALWLLEPARAQARAIDYPDSESARELIVHPGLPLAYVWADSGRIHRLDLAAAQLSELPTSAEEARRLLPDPRADALIALSQTAGEDRLLRISAAGAEPVLPALGVIDDFALEPDGSGAWILSSSRLQLYRWGAATLDAELELTAAPEAWQLVGSPAGLIAAYAPGFGPTVQPLRVAGAFCSAQLSAVPGLQYIEAVAENAGGVRSAPSPALQLSFDGLATLAPDLVVSAADIELLPDPPVLGQPHSLAIHTANLGALDAAEFEAEVEVRDPQGQLRSFRRTQSLAAGSASIWVLPLGPLTEAGDYQIDVQLDRADRIVESSELNNRAQRRISLRAGAGPWMRLGAVEAQRPPGQPFEGQLSLSTAAPFSGSVELRIEDSAGALVQTLPGLSVTGLTSTSSWTRSWRWEPQSGLLAGDYVLHARLLRASGQAVSEQRLTLSIEAVLQAQLVLQPAQAQTPIGQAVNISFGLDVPSANTVLAGAQLVLSAHAPDGSTQTLWSGNPGTLSAGVRLRRSASWSTAALAAGAHELRLMLTAPGLDRQLSRQVLLIEPQAPSTLRGEITLQPSPTWALGQATALEYRITHAGATPMTSLPTRLRVLGEPSRQELLVDLRSVDLAPSQTLSFQLDLDSMPQAPAPYLAVLEAQQAGEWRLLAQLGLQSTDTEAPQIELLAPLGTTPVRMPASLESEIRDRHSRVERAEYSLDGGPWTRLPGAGSRFATVLNGLADGEHVLSLRARDVWSNQRVIEPQTVVVDSTPPLIQVSGVEDAGLYRQPVTPSFSAQDPHLLHVRGWLNGQRVESGVALAQEGQYRFEVQALDAAGNRAARTLNFELDFTAPTLQIAAPAEGAQIGAAQVAVDVRSEPGALVALSIGAWQAQQTADADGRALFASAPLQLGVNRIEAQARDPAGNTSQPVAVQVQRVEPGGELSGDLLLDANTHPRGQPLSLRSQIRNGASAFEGELIVSVRAAAGTLLDELRQPLSLASAASFSQTFEMPTGAWPLGAAVAVLEVESGGTRQQLSAAGFDLLDRQNPDVQILQPQAAALISGAVLLEVAASDDDALAAVEYRIEQGNWIAFGASAGGGLYRASLSLADGAYSIEARARDLSGNTGTSAPRGFEVDSTAPTLIVEGVAHLGSYGEAVRPQVRVLDAHPDQLQLRLDGEPFESGTLIDRSGRFELSVDAVDAAGNAAQALLQFDIDLEPVDLQLSAPEQGAIFSVARTDVVGATKPNAQVSVTGPLSNHQLQADAAGLFRVADLPLSEGSNRIRVIAMDAFGRSSPELERSVFVDLAGSQGLGGSLEAGSEIAVDRALGVRVSLSETLGIARAGLQVRLRLEREGQLASELAWTTSLAASETQMRELELPAQTQLGIARLRLQVQLGSSWVDLTEANLPIVDRSAPVAAFLAPAADSYHAADLEIIASASDVHSELATVEVRERQGAWIALQRRMRGADWSGLLGPEEEGRLVLELRATDRAGNVSPVQTRAVYVDRSAPQIAVSGVEAGGLYARAVQIEVSASDASPTELRIELDGEVIQSGHWVQGHGMHRLRVEARDAAGNVSQQQFDFELDLEPPAVQVSTPQSGAVIRTESTPVLGQTEPQAEVRLQLNDVELRQRANGQGQFRFDAVPLRIGPNTLRLQATDRAGNVGAASSLSVERRGGFVFSASLQAPAEARVGAEFPIALSVLNQAQHAQPLVRLQLIVRDASGQQFSLLDRRHDFAAGERLDLQLQPDTSSWATGSLSLSLLATDEVQVQLAAASAQLLPNGPTLPPPLTRPVPIPAGGLLSLLILALSLAAFAWHRLLGRRASE